MRKLMQSQIDELESGDGLYYLTEERAFCPGISGEWPPVIKQGKNGRLVKNQAEEIAVSKIDDLVKFTMEADVSDLPMLKEGMGDEFNIKTYIKMALANYRLHAIENLKNTSKYEAIQLKELYKQQLMLGQRLADSIK